MKTLTAAMLCFCIAMLVVALGYPAKADEWNKKTIVTFSQPVEIPGGKILPAGTYVFKLLDSTSDRNVVQIFDKDQTQLYATVLAIPDYRRNPSDNTIIKFSETAAGGPVAIKEWFYPGDQYGQEFVYPKSRAVEIAKEANQPVPSMPTQMGSNVNEPAPTASESSVAEMEGSSLKAEEPTGGETEVAEVFIVHAPAPDEGAQAVAQKLPQTASLFPALCALGIFLMAFGGLFWVIVKRSS